MPVDILIVVVLIALSLLLFIVLSCCYAIQGNSKHAADDDDDYWGILCPIDDDDEESDKEKDIEEDIEEEVIDEDIEEVEMHIKDWSCWAKDAWRAYANYEMAVSFDFCYDLDALKAFIKYAEKSFGCAFEDINGSQFRALCKFLDDGRWSAYHQQYVASHQKTMYVTPDGVVYTSH